MPEQPDDYKPTETDTDMVVEETAEKPVNLAAGIASMRQCIAQLEAEAEKNKVLDRMDEGSGESLNDLLATVNEDLATVREHLTHY